MVKDRRRRRVHAAFCRIGKYAQLDEHLDLGYVDMLCA